VFIISTRSIFSIKLDFFSAVMIKFSLSVMFINLLICFLMFIISWTGCHSDLSLSSYTNSLIFRFKPKIPVLLILTRSRVFVWITGWFRIMQRPSGSLFGNVILTILLFVITRSWTRLNMTWPTLFDGPLNSFITELVVLLVSTRTDLNLVISVFKSCV